MNTPSAPTLTTDEFRLSPEIVRDLDVDNHTGQNVKGQTLKPTVRR